MASTSASCDGRFVQPTDRDDESGGFAAPALVLRFLGPRFDPAKPAGSPTDAVSPIRPHRRSPAEGSTDGTPQRVA